MNRAYVTKLAWKMSTQSENIWVQLVRAKHLRGRRLLDVQHTRQVSSWIWGGIRSCMGTLVAGMSYQVGHNSTLNLWDDPWLPQCDNHRLPTDVTIPANLELVRDIMTPDGLGWDAHLINHCFPRSIAATILKTPILNLEHDRPIWCPSSTGMFSIKSTYFLLTQVEFPPLHTAGMGRQWKMIWRANLHDRFKILLWRWLHRAVPTLDRISSFLLLSDTGCLLCGEAEESIHHLALDCQFARLIWWHSPWHIRTEAFKHLHFEAWVDVIFGQTSMFPFGEVEISKMQIFFVSLLEQMWLARNQKRVKDTPIHWEEIAKIVMREVDRHWRAGQNRLRRRKAASVVPAPLTWMPPLVGELKFNFDAAFQNGFTTVGCVLRNHHGIVMGAWVNRFLSVNPFCAETEAAIQALNIADDLNLSRVCFEGDASIVILALKGFLKFDDWHVFDKLEAGRALLSGHLFWSLAYVSRLCNSFAHCLAKWAVDCDFCGPVPPQLLSPSVWGVTDGC